ncbi:MAG: glycosyltransferase [Crocinitomicaceae bacterium TMED114]|nr:MAG: glycosyltransferase [Crocinitomicaceae bacterium TMED114]RPG81549.1 MAG: glycosyltransferase [Crocinitomicaceae bacterium TMED114]
MRVLQLCHKPPLPAMDGGCLAMDAITQGLLENGVEVKVLTASTRKHPIRLDDLSDAYLDATHLEAVDIETGFDLRDAYISFLNRDSYNISRFYAHHYAMVLKRALSRRRYDVVHLESLYTTPYIETIRRYAPNALISLRSHNHEYQIWEQRWKSSRNPLARLALRHLSKTLERYEKDILKDIDVIVSISEKEAQGYREWGFDGDIHVAGFGIDLSTRPAPPIVPQPTALKLFHLGAMDWGPNREGIQWFIREVWPQLHKAHPKAEFHIAGKGLNPKDHAEVAGLFNHGEVPDAQAFSHEMDLLVVPLLRGAGIRVKIVDAMAQGIPVATTNKGVHGLDMEGKGCLVHAEPAAFTAALSELLDHPERLTEMAQCGREEVEARFDREGIAERLIQFYAQHVQR